MKLVPPPVTLRQLQYVLAVAETRSFRHAAERCRVAQPSLSAQIAEAEAALGVRLFERDRRGALLTSAGAELVERAREVLVAFDDLLETARRHVDPLAGTLRLGVIPTIGPYLLPGLDPALRRAFPRLELRWLEDRTAALLRLVETGELDAALLALGSDLAHLEHEIVGRDPFVLARAAGDRRGGAATLAALRDQPVLLLEDGHCFRDQALDVCSKAGARELGFRATSLSTLAQMVAGGAGVTLLPRLAVEVENRTGSLDIRPFSRPAPYRTIVLAWRRRSALAPSLRAVAAVARRAFQSGCGPGAQRPRRTGGRGRPRGR